MTEKPFDDELYGKSRFDLGHGPFQGEPEINPDSTIPWPPLPSEHIVCDFCGGPLDGTTMTLDRVAWLKSDSIRDEHGNIYLIRDTRLVYCPRDPVEDYDGCEEFGVVGKTSIDNTPIDFDEEDDDNEHWDVGEPSY